MSKLPSAMEFLLDDIEKARSQWRDGEQFRSLLQRNDKSLNDLLDTFDPKPDEDAWNKEYTVGDKVSGALNLYSRRVAILKASRKEFHEEYDEDVTDVDFIRLLELPYTVPKYVIETTKEYLQE